MSIPSLTLGAEIVRRTNAKGRAVSNLKLKKLAYFCHGWHWALVREPLVDEAFEAWKLGPVLPSLYHTYKAFSSNPVPVDHPIVSTQDRLPKEAEATARLIDMVLDAYGTMSSADLVTISHEAGSPWERVWADTTSSATIPDAAIRAYFSQLAGQSATAP